MKININNEYVCNSSSQKFCNQNQCHYHKFLHHSIFSISSSSLSYSFSLISLLNNCPIVGGKHVIHPLEIKIPATFFLILKLYSRVNNISPHICFCICSLRMKVKNTFARGKSCHVNYFVLFLSLLLKASFTDFSFVPYNIDTNSCRVENKRDGNDDSIPRFMKHL